MKQRLLITGASGFLGWNLCQVAAAQWDIWGTYNQRAIAILGTRMVKVDVLDPEAVKTLFQTVRPEAVIHLAALSTLQACQTAPDASYQLNVQLPQQIAYLCAEREIPLVFTSTDQVFDGQHPPYRETDPVSPMNRYGEHKALAEEKILHIYPRAAICRMPLMFGMSPAGTNNFLQGFLATLRSGQELKLFMDEIRTPVSGKTAAQGLLLALSQVQGRLHLGGKDRLSRYDFGRLMVEVLQVTPAHLIACYQRDFPMPAPRPADVSLDSRQAFSRGYSPPSTREALASLRGHV